MSAMPLNIFADKLDVILPLITKEITHRHQNELYRGTITMPQFIILSYLEKQGPTRMTDLAIYMSVSTAAMTGAVSRLVRFGYVRREADPKDRRIIKVRLTAKGEAVVRRVHLERRQSIIDVFGKISEMEREDYLRILMRIQEVLSLQNKEPR
jgi:DNA-binding MarR family transcriptional regulator